MQKSLVVIESCGSHYEVGFNQGKMVSSRLQEYTRLPSFEKYFLWIQSTGQELFQKFLVLNLKQYPQYFEELQGLSDGSGVPLDLIQALNFYELFLTFNRDNVKWTNGDFTQYSCTDMLSNNGKIFMLGHNEDMYKETEVEILDFCWLGKSKVNEEALVTAFCWPGMLPGNAFSFNEFGIVISINYITPTDPFDFTGASTAFLCRDLISRKTINEVISHIPPRRASGVSINVASIHEHRLVNIELSPVTCCIREIYETTSHVNIYKYICDPCIHSDSTTHRNKRLTQFSDEELSNFRRILGDTENTEFSIYRKDSPLDNCETVATFICDLKARQGFLYIDNPNLHDSHLTFQL